MARTSCSQYALQSDVPQGCVGNITDEDPFDSENALPFIRGPYSAASRIVDRGQHLGHATEMAATTIRKSGYGQLSVYMTSLPCVYTKEQINRPSSCCFLVRLVQSLVAGVG